MSSVLTNIEFFAFRNEVWIRDANGLMRVLKVSDLHLINDMVEQISTFYPKAYAALKSIYVSSSRHPLYFRFRIVRRFIRCNFSVLDNVPDIDSDLHYTFEPINCPLAGECEFEHIICHPEFEHGLTNAEKRVLALVYKGKTESAIADHLHISPLTVHTHVHNVYSRLGIHSKSEFVKFATKHNLFS